MVVLPVSECVLVAGPALVVRVCMCVCVCAGLLIPTEWVKLAHWALFKGVLSGSASPACCQGDSLSTELTDD